MWLVGMEFYSDSGIERELSSRVDQRVLRWFGHVERTNVRVPCVKKGVDDESKFSEGTL